MAISDQEKAQIMQELAKGSSELPIQLPTHIVEEGIETKDYQNFDDFAQRDQSQPKPINLSLNNIKGQIQTDLNQAKEAGQLRAERIKEIVKSAVSQVTGEFKSGSNDIRSIVKDTISTVAESLQGKGGEITEEITASIEGAIEGISTWRRRSISKGQAEVKQIQIRIDAEEDELQQEIDRILEDVEEVGKDTSPKVKASIEAALKGLRDSEGVALLQKRYAQLQAQAAILKANLAARHGGRYEEVKEHLDEAKAWYIKTHPQAEVVIEKLEQKRSHLEQKLSEASVALAQKQRQARQILSELLHLAAEALKEKSPKQ